MTVGLRGTWTASGSERAVCRNADAVPLDFLPPPEIRMSTTYTQAPPSYGAATPPKATRDEASEPLLAGPSTSAAAGRAFAQELEDDFKVSSYRSECYRRTLANCCIVWCERCGQCDGDPPWYAPRLAVATTSRLTWHPAFVRKVYSILCKSCLHLASLIRLS